MKNILKIELGSMEKKLRRRNFKCIEENCLSHAINSHSQQRSGQLASIAYDKKVYALETDFYKLLDKRSDLIVKKGIGEASTFKGFCSKHDKDIFSPIEVVPLEIGRPDQAALLFYRSLAYELMRKTVAYEKIGVLCDFLKNTMQYSELKRASLWQAGIKHYIDVHSPKIMQAVSRAIENDPLGHIDFAWVEIGENIGISTCCVFQPIDDYLERANDAIKDEMQATVSFHIIPNEKSTHVLMVCLKEHEIYAREHMAALKDASKLEEAINKYAFSMSEDTCINPVLWSELGIDERNNVTHAIRHEYFRGPLHNVPAVVKIKSNISFQGTR